MLKVRVASAVLMALALLAIVYGLPSLGTLVLIVLIVLAGAWEWTALVPIHRYAGRALTVLVFLSLLTLAWRHAANPPGLRQILWIALLWWSVALLWILLAPQRVSRIAAALAGTLALGPGAIALVHLRMDYPAGSNWLLLALAVVAAADTGAYFAGKTLGRVKLAPQISPGKTWEGVVGGSLLAMMIAALGAKLLGSPLYAAVLAAAIAAGYSVVGDLTESMLKRHAGVKDSSALLPGHGGLLDRIDSICAGVPILLLCWIQFGVLA